jgi:hypothetical protein
MWLFIGAFIMYVIITIIALPFQYRYINAIEEMKKRDIEKTQGQMYDSLEFEEQVIHANGQGNFLFFGANIIASLIYKKRTSKGSR